MTHFFGTYQPEDVHFVLQPTQVKTISILEKEMQISQGVHYGHLLSRETAPTEIYQQLFLQTLERNAGLVAQQIISLAHELKAQEKTVLVSLARGGTPIGVLLKRTLELLGTPTTHYSISIIRDHGLDLNALSYITQQQPNQNLAFIDGWTGKGVINQTLKASLKTFDQKVSSDLYVLCDPAGVADTAATHEDYLLPNAMLNATISGLISRTTLSQTGYHAVMPLQELEAYDVTQFYIKKIMMAVKAHLSQPVLPVVHASKEKQAQCQQVLEALAQEHQLPINLIKPSIGEATRVFLRRQPKALILQKRSLDTFHLEELAANQCPIYVNSNLPYAAIALIHRQ
jgi:hypothetical protein